MSKRTVFTTVTPLPSYMPRDLVIETLHSHSEMIQLNPLVIKHKPCKAPPNATADEFHCTWYELTDNVHYLPGGMLSGNVSYKACFHDLPRGLQTHVYAPTGLDIKEKWSVCGNMPHEPREPIELGLTDAPREGLYLREDVDMRSNILVTSFVKKTLRKAHAVLVDRLVVKADLMKGKRDRESLAPSFHQSPYSNPYASSRPSSISTSGHISYPPNQGLGVTSPGFPSQDYRSSGSQDPRLQYASPLPSPYYPTDISNADQMSGCGGTSGVEPSIHKHFAEAPSGHEHEKRTSSPAPPARPPKINDTSKRDEKSKEHPQIAELA